MLSTSTEHIPFKKYLILAGAFTQFCRLVNSNQRPKRVHIFWPTGIDPIILIDDASLFFRDPQYNSRDGYREFTLEYLFSSPGLAGNTMPDCDCSQLIPAILYVPLPESQAHAPTFRLRSLNEGQTLQFFSADFAKLLSLLKYYRKEGGGFAPFKSAARPACDTCRTLMWGIGLHYEDLVSISFVHRLVPALRFFRRVSTNSNWMNHHPTLMVPYNVVRSFQQRMVLRPEGPATPPPVEPHPTMTVFASHHLKHGLPSNKFLLEENIPIRPYLVFIIPFVHPAKRRPAHMLPLRFKHSHLHRLEHSSRDIIVLQLLQLFIHHISMRVTRFNRPCTLMVASCRDIIPLPLLALCTRFLHTKGCHWDVRHNHGLASTMIRRVLTSLSQRTEFYAVTRC